MVYGDEEQVVRETFENVDDLQREEISSSLGTGPQEAS
jgi:hypothetical protein